MSWSQRKLGELCEITSSKRIFYSEYVESGVPFYRSKEIIESSQGMEISEPLFISEEKYEEIKNKFGVPTAGDMLLTSVGTIGVPYIVKDSDRFYFKDGNLTWFRKYSTDVIPEYIYFWVRSTEGQGVLNNTTIGSSQKALTISSLKKIEIAVPPVNSQKAIVKMLSVYDNLIENNQKQIKLLEEAVQRLYKEWFVDLHFPGYEDAVIVDGVPEGWAVCKLGNIVAINSENISKNYPYSHIEYVDLGSVRLGHINEITSYTLANAPGRAKRIAQDGDTIWGMVRPNLRSYALVMHPSIRNVYSTGFAVISPKKVPFTYLYCLVTQDSFIGYLINCTNGAAYPAVKPEHFEKAIVLKPNDQVLGRFHEIAEPIFRKIENLDKNIASLAEARDRLLPKLMSGEIEV
ncbi:EcoKI restriction-modification system protein HsdS [uncultured Clostridium sp.]|uniref:Restriction endonuclease subunit S n=1 Tax=Muricoprocola aceti TaxID=2981772 RepID=A0ABT2SGY5_9FIRM|nr:restriction endonuclease subunit S [Muricoprocola aceti]MCU6723761.1 restriction endonuclease subunit S [Muricoprocola aceti]SCG90684.1 EcoKI restriction-modification system protein HsdS [uncultured Clostridium sp.]